MTAMTMNRKLELKDIAGYIPYGLYIAGKDNEYPQSGIVDGLTKFRDRVMVYCEDDGEACEFYMHEFFPVLRPLSDLYRTIIHNGKEIIPIIECLKISHERMRNAYGFEVDKIESNRIHFGYGSDNCDWVTFWYDAKECSFKSFWDVPNQYKLFDYLHELKLDYRGLVDAKLAVSCYDLETNPYK